MRVRLILQQPRPAIRRSGLTKIAPGKPQYGFGAVGMPAACQASSPPLSGQTWLKPACCSASARPALEPSFSQVQ